MGNAGDNLLCSLALEQSGSHGQCACGFGQIIHQQGVFSSDFANNCHGFNFAGALPPLGHNCKSSIYDLRIGVGHL